MILLNFDGNIKGDAQQAGHEDWINLTSINAGVGRAITVSGSGKDRDTSTPSFSTTQSDRVFKAVRIQRVVVSGSRRSAIRLKSRMSTNRTVTSTWRSSSRSGRASR